MMIYHITVRAMRERFMELALIETLHYYVSADSYEQARDCVFEMLNRGGWKPGTITHEMVPLIDARVG